MNILVIGGNGFIGSHVIDALLASGTSVTALDRGPIRPSVDWARSASFRYVQGDLRDASVLELALEGVDCVLHLASSAVPASAAKDPIGDVQNNLVGSLGIFEAMARRGARRIIYLSSGGTVYGATKEAVISEEHTCAPISGYGIVKLAIEHYLGVFARAHGFSTLVLRPSNPFGPRQIGDGVQGLVAAAIRNAMTGAPLEIWGDGSVVRDYMYIDDLVALIVATTLSDRTGVYNAGTGVGASVIDVVDTVRRVSQRELPLHHKPAAASDVSRIVLDSRKAAADFDWAPRVSLEEGVRRTWEFANRRGTSWDGHGRS